jgi:hypothetical protein
MSTFAIQAATSAAPPSTNIRLEDHKHKRGLQLNSLTDPSSAPASKAPSGGTRDLFSTLLNSLKTMIGFQPAPAGAASQAAVPAVAAASGGLVAGESRINLSA